MKPPTRTLCCLLALAASQSLHAQPSPAAAAAYDREVQALETRLAAEHRTASGYPAGALSAPQRAALAHGELLIERIPSSEETPGALLHHWRGTAFAPGATAAQLERLLRDFDAYPRRYAPEVVQARVLNAQDNRLTAQMRVRQHHVLTVVMDTTYAVSFGRLDAQHGWSGSRSTQIDEIAAAGTAREHALSPTGAHGFLWRMNTCWSWEERDGGVYLQVESLSLSRDIPVGLGWAVRPFVESIPRESLEFTLRATCDALRNNAS
jgi:hypothetical protein